LSYREKNRANRTFGRILAPALFLLAITSYPVTGTTGDLDGSRASFLLDFSLSESSLNYLSYEMTDQRRSQFRQRLSALGDTHIYLYTQNGSSNDVLPVGYRSWFRDKLVELNASGLKPILWLTPDDSPNITGNIPAWQYHVSAVIGNLDDQVSGYVLCLECDEYWSGATVTTLLHWVKGKTSKPIGVHLSPGPGGVDWDPTYYAGADYIFLQLGFTHEQSGYNIVSIEQKKAILLEALNLGIPIIAAEYSLDSDSPEAKAFGDWACENGAVGTGNGRSITACGQSSSTEEDFLTKNSGVFAAVGIAIAAVWVTSTFSIPITMQAVDEFYYLSFEKQINDAHTVGLTYGEDGTVVLNYRFSF
jgi:hypothetical protein